MFFLFLFKKIKVNIYSCIILKNGGKSMWFISYNNSKNEPCYVEKIFENRVDAFKYINVILNKNVVSNISVNNGDSNLITPLIKEGMCLSLYQNKEVKHYGIVEEISDYLVFIRKFNGDIAEFTKGRINKEFIRGKLFVE